MMTEVASCPVIGWKMSFDCHGEPSEMIDLLSNLGHKDELKVINTIIRVTSKIIDYRSP